MKIGIVGTGMVGATTAYALVMRGVGRELVLIDHDHQRAQAEADDILHAVPFAHPMIVRAGQYSDLVGAQVVVVAAGVNQQPGETRIALLRRNQQIFREVIPQILRSAPQCVLIVATNPVDILTHLSTQIAVAQGGDPRRVIGSGTTLDTARFRTILGAHIGIDAKHVHANVLGEHGDSEVLVWSAASVAGQPIGRIAELRGKKLGDEDRRAIDDAVRNAAYRIIQGKRATYYGVASAIAAIVDAVLSDRRAVFTVSAITERVGAVDDVTLSLPRVIGGGGVLTTLPTPLSQSEQVALQRSAGVIREAVESLAK